MPAVTGLQNSLAPQSYLHPISKYEKLYYTHAPPNNPKCFSFRKLFYWLFSLLHLHCCVEGLLSIIIWTSSLSLYFVNIISEDS